MKHQTNRAAPVVFRVMFIVMCLAQGSPAASDRKECTTQACKDIAKRMQAMMNTAESPCQDFSQYACGKFYKDAVIPKSKMSVGYSFDELREKSRKDLKNLLESPVKLQGDDSYERKMKAFYKACLNTDAMEAHGLKDYKESDRLEWPSLSDQWRESSFNLKTLVTNHMKQFTMAFFTLDLAPDNNLPERKLIPVIMRPRNSNNPKALEKYYIDVAVALGGNAETAKSDAEEVVKFIYQMDKQIYQKIRRFQRDSDYTLQEMESKFPYLDWIKTFQAVFDNVDVKIDPSQRVRSELSLSGLGDVFSKTNKRTIQNFAGFKRAVRIVGEANKKMRDIKVDFDKNKQHRDEYCMDKVQFLYNLGLSKLFSDDIYPKKSQAALYTMANHVKEAFKDTIEKTSLMNQDVKNKALLKLKDMVVRIGVPSKHFDTKDVNEHFKNFVVKGDDFNPVQLQNEKEDFVEHLKNINIPFKQYNWFKLMMTSVRSYMVWEHNELAISLGALQPPNFDKNNPSYLNYGSVGNILASLIHSGLDRFGGLYDERGLNNIWWTNDTLKEHDSRANCFIEQYSNLDDKELDIKMKSDEIDLHHLFDDKASITIAYKSYQKYASKNVAELPLPGLGLTKDQLFFLSFAQKYCVKYTREELLDNMKHGLPSPALRIIGTLQNSNAFSNAFKCKSTDYMNPAKKCSFW